MDIKNMNTTALAYLGDAVYEVFVRERVLSSDAAHVDRLHARAVKYVRAEGQAYALKGMFEELRPEEQNLVKRARNRKITSKPKNADPVVYKLATAFEALAGYLYLSAQTERLEEIFEQAVRIIDEGGVVNEKTKR
ncbi:MAG: ribonuclease III [Clostridia bacterium]|nr:ribonuclease III [Clostridia bacterium]